VIEFPTVKVVPLAVPKPKRMSYFPSPSALKSSVPSEIVGVLKVPDVPSRLKVNAVALSSGFKLKYSPLINSPLLKPTFSIVKSTVPGATSRKVAVVKGPGPAGGVLPLKTVSSAKRVPAAFALGKIGKVAANRAHPMTHGRQVMIPFFCINPESAF
jgi:hypothetical protein